MRVRQATTAGNETHMPMFKYSLLRLARRELTRATYAPSGVSATELPAPWQPGATVLALRSGRTVPTSVAGPRSLQVLVGRVRVTHERVVTLAFPGDVVCCAGSAAVVAQADTALLVVGG